VIALCCDYSEGTYEEIVNVYGIDYEDQWDTEETVRQHLEYNSHIVGEVDGGFVYAIF
jgi:hypothetical protein